MESPAHAAGLRASAGTLSACQSSQQLDERLQRCNAGKAKGKAGAGDEGEDDEPEVDKAPSFDDDEEEAGKAKAAPAGESCSTWQHLHQHCSSSATRPGRRGRARPCRPCARRVAIPALRCRQPPLHKFKSSVSLIKSACALTASIVRWPFTESIHHGYHMLPVHPAAECCWHHYQMPHCQRPPSCICHRPSHKLCWLAWCNGSHWQCKCCQPRAGAAGAAGGAAAQAAGRRRHRRYPPRRKRQPAQRRTPSPQPARLAMSR